MFCPNKIRKIFVQKHTQRNQSRYQQYWPAFQNFFTKVKGFLTDLRPFLHAEHKNTVYFPGSGLVFKI